MSDNWTTATPITRWGSTMTLAEWSDLLGISPGLLLYRLERWGNVPRVLDPVRKAKVDEVTLHCDGMTRTVREWAEIKKLSTGLIMSRRARGLSDISCLQPVHQPKNRKTTKGTVFDREHPWMSRESYRSRFDKYH